MVRNVRMSFNNKSMLRKIIAMVRPKLAYAEVLWSLNEKNHKKIRKIRRIAIELETEL